MLRSQTSLSDPLGRRRVETFWNSLSHGCPNRDSSVSSSVPSQDAGWGRTGMPSCFAPRPPGAIRSGVAGRKPSGISAATVLRPWCLGQFQLSFPAQPRRIPRSFGHGREAQRHPCRWGHLSKRKREENVPSRGYGLATGVPWSAPAFLPGSASADGSLLRSCSRNPKASL